MLHVILKFFEGFSKELGLLKAAAASAWRFHRWLRQRSAMAPPVGGPEIGWKWLPEGILRIDAQKSDTMQEIDS